MNDSDTSGSAGGGSERRRSMSEREEKERRASIQAIMRDPTLTPVERRGSIQRLMDGRRRSSTAAPAQNGDRRSSGANVGAMGMDMAAAAAMAAAEFYDSSEEEDEDGMHDDSDQHLTQNMRTSSHTGEGNKREARKRSSFLFKQKSPSKLEDTNKRRMSGLRQSFTAGFSKMGMSSSGEDGKPSADLSQSICLPAERNELSKKMEQSRPPCQHYERNCSIVSPCCGLVFGCRICHDDAPELPPPFLLTGEGHPQNPGFAATSAFAASGGGKPPAISHRSVSLPPNFTEEESHHEIDRFLIKEVVCRECFTRQSSKTNNCIACGVQFGTYHCSICNLWMSADEDPYHCVKCGFCRVGGRENFAHCDDCGMCIDALLFEDHNCKSGKYMSNCPVCQEDLFSSRMASHEMPCGHAIHWHCFRELTSHDTRCPVCKKTAETHDQMEQTWSAMAMGIALQPVPADMARVVDILCNDCEGKSENQRWHFLGVQCRQCTSFNTTVERTVLVGQEAADFLGPLGDVALAWAAGGADQNVLAALMGGGAAAAAAGIPPPGEGDDGMDAETAETLNQSVAAEVLAAVNRSHQPPPGTHDNDFDEMDQSM
ncbi:hypothetical protein ACHAXT_007727 [Thalassiosira profunda]